MNFNEEILSLLKAWDYNQRGANFTEITGNWNDQVLFHLKKITEVI